MEKTIELGEYEVLEDMLVDGLKMVQDTRLYRFTSDSVLLSRFAKARNGEKVADFCITQIMCHICNQTNFIY